jgi:hypothetical protein
MLTGCITLDSRNTPSTTNLEDEEVVDAPGKDGKASMPEQVKRPNPWRKMMMMMPVKKKRYIQTQFISKTFFTNKLLCMNL